jgi:ATP-dependent DNA helicase RecG
VRDFPRLEGSLLVVLEEAYRLVGSLVRMSVKLHDLFFRETPEYPIFAWQEALVNALAHRDYGVEGRGVEVWVYDDRMEVKSPGGLVPEVTLEALLDRRRVHVSRNPRLARVLTELGIMREQGEGIPRMIEEMELSWLPAPEFRSDEREFMVTLRNAPIFEGSDARWTSFARSLPIDVRQKRALVAFHDREFQSGDYQGLNRVDRDLAYRELQELESRGLVQASGATKGRRYRVLKAGLPAELVEVSPRDRLARRMQEAGRLTNADYREAFGVGRFEATRALAALVEEGALELKGARRGAHYVPGASWSSWLQK